MPDEHLGPVDYLVVEFRDAAQVHAGFDHLLRLVDAGLIRILDLEFVTAADGAATTITATQAAAGLTEFDGAAAGLLDRNDLDAIAADMTPGTTAAVLVYEDLSILGVIEAWERDGARIMAEGPIDVDDIDTTTEGI